jgi:hypothetical protein
MHHRACGLALIVILATGGRAVAQERIVHFGITGGVNVSELNVGGSEALNVVLRHLFWQPVGGALLAIRATDTFTIQPEVLWSRKGTRMELPNGEGKLTLTYIEVPVLARYEGPAESQNRLHIFVGPYGAYLLRARSRLEIDNAVVSRSVDDDIEQIDWGVVTGAGVQFGPAVVIDFRYAWGIQDVVESPASVIPGAFDSDLTFRNRAFTGMMAIRF